MKTIYVRTADNIAQTTGYAKIAHIPTYTNQSFATNNNIAILTIDYVGAFGAFGEQYVFAIAKNSNSAVKITPLTFTTKAKKITNILASVTVADGIDLYVKSAFDATSCATKIKIEELTAPFASWIQNSKFVDISDLSPSYSSTIVLDEETLNLDYSTTSLQGSTNKYDQLLYGVSCTFTNGTATKDLTSIIGDNSVIMRTIATINNGTNTDCIITSASISSKILTLKAANSFSGTRDINLVIYIKK